MFIFINAFLIGTASGLRALIGLAAVSWASHVPMEAKRTAMETLANSSKIGGYDTNHDTSVSLAPILPV
jgi:hypothetical protein